MHIDFTAEIGARRKRFRPEQALSDYLQDMRLFAKAASRIVRPGGFVAMVVGEPQAQAFSKQAVLASIDNLMLEEGFSLVWHTWRSVQWHRNHGYAKIKAERVVVYRNCTIGSSALDTQAS
jgi:methylase of polypeptide subunit release factors